jgi:hypothetical protein
MGHIFQIGQSQCLALIDGQRDLLQVHHGNTTRLEIADIRAKGYDATFAGTGHRTSIMGIYSNRRKIVTSPENVKGGK